MAITELYDLHSCLPLSFYNTSTLTSQLLNITPRGVSKQNLTTVKTPLMWWFSPHLLSFIFLFLLSTMTEEQSSITVIHHTTPSNLTYDTSKYPCLHYLLPLSSHHLPMFSSSACNYNDKVLHQIMHNTMSHLSNIS